MGRHSLSAGKQHPRSLPLLRASAGFERLTCAYTRAKQERNGAHLGKEGFLFQTSQSALFPVSCCWGRHKHACTHTGVCSGECRGVERDLRPGGKWYCFSLLPQLEELARAAGRVCVGLVSWLHLALAAHLQPAWARLLSGRGIVALVACFPLSTILFC